MARRKLRAEGVQPFDRDVLDVLIELIPLYSRTSDDVGARQIAAIIYDVDNPTGYQRDRVGASLRRLALNDVVELDAGRGRNSRTVIRFPIDGAGAPDSPVDNNEEGSADALGSEDKASASDGESQRETTTNPARRVGHSEKNPEKNPEDDNDESIDCTVAAAVEHIVRNAVTANGNVRDRAAYEAKIRAGIDPDRICRLRKIIPEHRPDTPIAMFSGFLLGEPTNLWMYRKKVA